MDPLMNFFTWQFMLFSLAVAGVTFILRKVIEYYAKNITKNTAWEDLVLPIFPLVLGCLMGKLMTAYPYPDGLNSVGGRVIFGLVVGMFSGLVYRVLNSLLNVKAENPTSVPSEQQEIIDSVRNSIQK